jgi:Flp pilus assembly protein TadG
MKLLKDENGQSLVLASAIMGIVMLGFLALAADIGYLFQQRRMAQAAADAAAVAAAEEDSYAGDSGNAQAAANAAATMNGFNTSAATNPAVVTLSSPTSGNYSKTGSNAAPSSWVKAVVSKPVQTFFLGTFNSSLRTVTVTASATAGGAQSSPTCVCLEGQSGQDLNMSNNAKFVGNSCGITVDSSSSNAVGIVGSASVCALTLGTVSSNWDNSNNINNNGSICAATKVVQGISTQCAPTMPAAPTYNAAQCSGDPISGQQGGAKYTVGPGSAYGTTQGTNTICYNSLTVNGNGDTVTLNPGIYVINGGELHFESGTNGGGNGVLFYLTGNANLVIDNGANVNLVAGGNTESGGGTAPSTGAYNGILIYQDANDSKTISIQGGSSAFFSGGIYAPSAAISLGNGSGTTVNADIVAQSLTMNGGGTLQSSSGANLGTLNISTAKVTQ